MCNFRCVPEVCRLDLSHLVWGAQKFDPRLRLPDPTTPRVRSAPTTILHAQGPRNVRHTVRASSGAGQSPKRRPSLSPDRPRRQSYNRRKSGTQDPRRRSPLSPISTEGAQGHRSKVAVTPTITDSRGNGAALNKQMTSRYPASAILTEMSTY